MENEKMMKEKDLDEDIQSRQSLIEQAQNLQEDADWRELVREIEHLKRSWKRISYWESAYEDKLEEEFEAAIDALYAKRNEVYQNAHVIKKELLERARELSVTTNFHPATEEMNELMRQWKAAGSAGNDDDQLWDEFTQLRQLFYDNKHQHWEELQQKFENSRQQKHGLIQEALLLADSTEWQKTSEKMQELLEQWKKSGSAGREYDDQLWNEFNEARQKFYDKRNQHYDELHEIQKGIYEVKKGLVEKAQAILDTKQYTRENTELMQNLSKEWKQAGSCGKKYENQIWDEFRTVMDEYFSGLREANEQKHQQWRQRMMDARKHKMDLIASQKRQLKRMQENLVGLLSQREYDMMTEDIEDKKEFIKELEEQLEDIDQALAK